jgi:hypothetical protein
MKGLSASPPPSSPPHFPATLTSQKRSARYPKNFELLSIKNAATQVCCPRGQLVSRTAAEPSRVSEFYFLPLTPTGGGVAQWGTRPRSVWREAQ